MASDRTKNTTAPRMIKIGAALGKNGPDVNFGYLAIRKYKMPEIIRLIPAVRVYMAIAVNSMHKIMSASLLDFSHRQNRKSAMQVRKRNCISDRGVITNFRIAQLSRQMTSRSGKYF